LETTTTTVNIDNDNMAFARLAKLFTCALAFSSLTLTLDVLASASSLERFEDGSKKLLHKRSPVNSVRDESVGSNQQWVVLNSQFDDSKNEDTSDTSDAISSNQTPETTSKATQASINTDTNPLPLLAFEGIASDSSATPHADQTQQQKPIRITHYNRHPGVENNIYYILAHLNLTDYLKLNPDSITSYGPTHDQAEKLRHGYQSSVIRYICKTSDVIIVGDTIPDSRPFMLELVKGSACRETNIVFEVTQRFDFAILDDVDYKSLWNNNSTDKLKNHTNEYIDPTTSYLGLVRKLIQLNLPNVHWVSNNPYEPEYVYARTGIRAPFHVIRPVGYSPVRDGEVRPNHNQTINPCAMY
jgi:hypothetical protein